MCLPLDGWMQRICSGKRLFAIWTSRFLHCRICVLPFRWIDILGSIFGCTSRWCYQVATLIFMILLSWVRRPDTSVIHFSHHRFLSSSHCETRAHWSDRTNFRSCVICTLNRNEVPCLSSPGFDVGKNANKRLRAKKNFLGLTEIDSF